MTTRSTVVATRSGNQDSSDSIVDVAGPADYPALVSRVRTEVESSLATDATIAVLSNGDPELTAFAAHNVRHFPADELGTYLGYHPRNGPHAAELLRAERHRGITHLVIPATSHWWLDYYREFGHDLETEWRVLADVPGTCTIYGPPETEREAETEHAEYSPASPPPDRFAVFLRHLLVSAPGLVLRVGWAGEHSMKTYLIADPDAALVELELDVEHRFGRLDQLSARGIRFVAIMTDSLPWFRDRIATKMVDWDQATLIVDRPNLGAVFEIPKPGAAADQPSATATKG